MNISLILAGIGCVLMGALLFAAILDEIIKNFKSVMSALALMGVSFYAVWCIVYMAVYLTEH